jgi:hypothetical protein
LSEKKVLFATQYTYEKRWVPTTESEALRMIEEEMPETDARATLNYIMEALTQGKSVTLGECRFKILKNG